MPRSGRASSGVLCPVFVSLVGLASVQSWQMDYQQIKSQIGSLIILPTEKGPFFFRWRRMSIFYQGMYRIRIGHCALAWRLA